MKVTLNKISVLFCLIFLTCNVGYSQRKPVKKSVPKEKIEISFGESEISTAAEEDESVWKEFVDAAGFFKISFPDKPVKGERIDTFNKMRVTRHDYTLQTQKALYIAGYMPVKASANDNDKLNKLYDIYVKESLDKGNVGRFGEKEERMSVTSQKDFSVSEYLGREISFQDTDTGEFKMVILFVSGKMFYLSVLPSITNSELNKEIVERSTEKFFKSFQLIKK